MNSYMEQSPQTPPTPTFPNDHPETVSQQPTKHTSPPKLPLIIGGIVSVLLTLLAVGGYVMYSTALTELKTITRAQIDTLEKLEGTYAGIIKTLDEKPSGTQDTTNSLLKSKPRKLKDVNVQVLGAEEDLAIQVNRKLADHYKKGKSYLKTIKEQNVKIQETYQNPLIKPFLPDLGNLPTETAGTVRSWEAILTYLNESNTIEINAKTLGYQFGMAMREAIMREADDESVDKLREKYLELDTIYDQYKALETAELPEDMQQSHEDGLDSFDKDIAVFGDLVQGFEDKDVDQIEKSIQSMVIQGESETTAAEIEMRSFWNDHDSVKQVEELKDAWISFATNTLGIVL